MYSKIILKFLNIISYILIKFYKMCTRIQYNYEKKLYKFKPYVFNEIIPNINEKIPLPRSGHRICADKSNFYLFGGFNPKMRNQEDIEDESSTELYPLFQELWKYNFASNSWCQYPNGSTFPMELASHAMIMYKNLLMIYGGTGFPFGKRCSNQLYICNVKDDKGIMRHIKTTGKHPPPLYGQALVFDEDYLYTIGGTTGILYTCDIHRLNLKTLKWVDIYLSKGVIDCNEPEGRYRHEVAFDGENIYILGGGTAQTVYDFKSIPTFNLKKSEWRTTSTISDVNCGIPSSRKCYGSVQVNIDDRIQIFITGGHDSDIIFDDLWKLDLKTYQWTCFSTCVLPKEIFFHASAVTPQGRLYIFGGAFEVDIDKYERVNTVCSTWICIPKLSEICWDAVLFYFPHVVNYNQNMLIDLGFPKNFITRLPNKH